MSTSIKTHKSKNQDGDTPSWNTGSNNFLDKLNVFRNSHTSYHETRLPFLQIAGSGFLPLPIVTSPPHPHSFTKEFEDNTVKAQDSRLSEVDGSAVNPSLSSHTYWKKFIDLLSDRIGMYPSIRT